MYIHSHSKVQIYNTMWNFVVIFVQIFIIGSAIGLPCVPRHCGYDSIVCVCNSTYCDKIRELPKDLLQQGYYVHYVSSRGGERLNFTAKPINSSSRAQSLPNFTDTEYVRFSVNASERYQKMKGFGGAMTDSSGINIASLSREAQNKLLRQYFGDEGIGYTFIRIPMGGTDFSTRSYTYDDVANDISLSHFNLTEEDLNFKIPYVKESMEMSSIPIRLLATPWTSPDWMKESTFFLRGFTRLQKKYYQLYADYFIKFLDAYNSHGLSFWALTPQNEPEDGRLFYFGINSMGWSPNEERDWVTNNLGPTLHANGYGNIEIMILDDQRPFLPFWLSVMGDQALSKYVSGFAIHWYLDAFPFSLTFLDEAHRQYPDKFILYTEASIVHYFPFEPAVSLGKWKNAERYAESILEVVNHWSTGWVDWNIALDANGGPNWASNTVDAPIIVNSTADEFYKQPAFYALAHVSKFVPPGSQRIQISSEDSRGISSAAFLREDSNVAIVLLNRGDSDIECIISVDRHDAVEVSIPAHSIHTILYKHAETRG